MGELLFFVIAILIILLEEYVMTNTRYFWLGAVIPTLGAILGITLMIMTNSYGFRDFLAVGGLIFGLLIFWGDGHSRYKKKMAIKSSKKADNQE